MENSPTPTPAIAPATKSGGPNRLLMAMAVLMLVVGYAAGATLGSRRNGCQDADKAALKVEMTKKLTDAGLIQQEELPMTGLTGKLTAMSGNVLTLEVGNLNRNPLADPTPKVRTVTVADGASMALAVQRTSQEMMEAEAAFQKEQTAAMKKLNAGAPSSLPTPPSPFKEVPLKLSDLKVGQEVFVMAETDVRTATSFTAKTVQVQQPLAMPNAVITQPEEMATAPASR